MCDLQAVELRVDASNLAGGVVLAGEIVVSLGAGGVTLPL